MAHLAGRAATVLVAACTALGVAAAPASATVFVAVFDGDTVWITTSQTADTITVTCAAGQVEVATATTPPLACNETASMIVDPNGPDTVDLSGVTVAAFPQLDEASVDASDTYADVLTGWQGRDVITADGKDTVTAGEGDDWVQGAKTASGGPGDDTLREISSDVVGGPGNDRIVNPGAGPFSGGDGYDVLVQDYTASTVQQPVTLAISDTVLGPAPGFGVESTGIEEYDITTSTGARADSIDSRAYSGVLVVATLGGNDIVRSGPGADAVDGGAGDDVLDPGPGADLVRGGAGNDAIAVRDGVADSVDCGDGTDTVVADRADVLTGCENVSLPPPDTSPIVGPKKVKKGHKPKFTFSSPAAGAQFECAVDAKPFKPCESPFHVKTRKLKQGKHTLSVRAVQPAGNADPTPSTFRFKVLPKKK